MLLFLATAALAGAPCNSTADRADTSCWLDTWESEGRASIDMGIKSGKKWVTIKLDGETVSEGQLEGRTRRTAALDGCGAKLSMTTEGLLTVALEGPECPIEAATTYRRKGQAKLAIATHCGRKTLFTCVTNKDQVASVCQDKSLDAQGRDAVMTSLVIGTVGRPEMEITPGVSTGVGSGFSWLFTTESGTYRLGATGNTAEITQGDTSLGICQLGWYKAN